MIRVGVVGLGAWGWNVARSFAEAKDCQLVTCCDVDAKRTSAALRNLHAENAAASLTEMLQRDSIDAVVISSPAVTHYALAKEALLADKDVLIEKPFTLNVAHAEELVELAERRRRVLMVGHLLEYHPVVRKLRTMIQSKE